MKRILKEYGDKQTTRDKMAKAAKRSLERDGDDSTYHNAINSLTKRGSSREEMQDFQDKFEKNENRNMKKQVKLSEADLHQVIKGAVESLLKEYTDFDKMKMYGKPTQDEDDFNEQPVNDIAAESRQYKVNESQLHQIIKESVMRILNEVYTGDEPFVPNKYPGQVPKFHSKEEYDKWWHDEAPEDWFDWVDDRKWQRTGIQPGYSAMANKADWDRIKGKMSWNNDNRYLRFNQLKQKNGIQ